MRTIHIQQLIWDDVNVAHIALHNVTVEEVERVCLGLFLASETYGGRLRIIGNTEQGKPLTIILAPTAQETAYYPVTARAASRKERKQYLEWKGGVAA